MTKHRLLRESIKSFFGSHVDEEKEEELKESKAEIEEKVQKILDHLKDQSEKDMKESLSTLIEDFHKQYQFLYARYDHLTGELRKKVHGKQEKESSSSSSDSDSDYTPTKKGSKNGKLDEDYEKIKGELKQELENASLEISDLKMKLAIAQEERDAHNAEKFELLAENEDLKKKLQSAAEIEAELNQKLVDAMNEKHKLVSEKEAAMVQLEERNKVFEDLRICSNQLKDEIEELNKKLQTAAMIEAEVNQKLADVINEKNNLILEKEATVVELEERDKVAEDLKSHSIQLKDEIEELNKKLQSAAEIQSELNQKLADATNEKHNLISEKEAALAQVGEGNKVAEDLRSISSQLKDEIEESNKKLQSAAEIEAELNQKLLDVTNEKHNLISEKEAAIAQVEEGNKVAEDLRSYSSQLKDDIEELNKKLQSTAEIEAELNQKLADAINEKHNLISKKEAAMAQVEEGNKIAEDLRSYNSQLKDEKAAVVLELEATVQKLTLLNEELESSEKEIAELRKVQTASVEENSALSSKILLISEEIKLSQNKIQELVTESSQLKMQLDEKEKELLTHAEMHESHKNEVSSHIRGLELELDSLHDHRKELEKQKGEEVSELLKKLENKEKDSSSQIEDLMAQNKNLQLQIDSLLIQKSDLEKQLSQNINEASVQAKDLTEQLNLKQQELESLVSHLVKLEGQLEEKTQEIAEFLIQIEGLKEELAITSAQHQTVLEDKENSIFQLKNLEQEVSSLQNTKGQLEEQVGNKSEEIAHLHEEKESLQSKFLEMERVVAERDNEICVLKKTSEDREVESSAKSTSLTTELNDLQERLNLLLAQVSESDSLLEQKTREIVENTDKIGSLQEELTSKSADAQILLEEKEGLAVQLKDLELEVESLRNGKGELEGQLVELEKKLRDQEDAFSKLHDEHIQLELRFQECKKNLEATDTKMKEVTVEYQNSSNARSQKVNELEEIIDELKGELEMKVDEISSLVENVRNTEVKLRLANQKLRITEQLLTEKEDSQRSKEEKLLEGQKVLEERITVLSELVADYKEAQNRIISDAPESVNVIMTNFDTFNMKFEEDYSHLESRIYEILNEHKVIMNWIKDSNYVKEQLKMELDSLIQQLNNERHHSKVIKENVGELEKIIQKKEDEKDHLVKSIETLEGKIEELGKIVRERDEMMGQLELQMKGKDKGILELGEEKREAIRQLCVWIEYHRDRYDTLKEIVSKTTTARRHIAA